MLWGLIKAWMLSSAAVVGVFLLFNNIKDIEDSSMVVVGVCLLLTNIEDSVRWLRQQLGIQDSQFYTPSSWHGPEISLSQPPVPLSSWVSSLIHSSLEVGPIIPLGWWSSPLTDLPVSANPTLKLSKFNSHSLPETHSQICVCGCCVKCHIWHENWALQGMFTCF